MSLLQSVKRKLSSSPNSTPAPATASDLPSTMNTSPKKGDVARSDLSLPRRERRRSSVQRSIKIAALKDLPQLKETSMQKREVRQKMILYTCRKIRELYSYMKIGPLSTKITTMFCIL